MQKNKHRTVWSSEQGDLRKRKTQSNAITSLPPYKQTAYVHRESKGRGGKTVTLVKNLTLSSADMKTLTKTLKTACGSGGTIKDRLIEIQGEHREKIAVELKKQGYQVKIAGG